VLVVIGRGPRHLTGQNWILLALDYRVCGFYDFGLFLVIFDDF
jgi:hypothetical protein